MFHLGCKSHPVTDNIQAKEQLSFIHVASDPLETEIGHLLISRNVVKNFVIGWVAFQNGRGTNSWCCE